MSDSDELQAYRIELGPAADTPRRDANGVERLIEAAAVIAAHFDPTLDSRPRTEERNLVESLRALGVKVR